MLHLGDITKISGYTAPIVDVVVGGSPCQDLSVAGKRAGLDGERSGLFMEQLRIIKEMRERDRNNRNGADVDIRPRYMLWENVPGAFSSNKAEDFRIVLEETAKVCDKDAVIPMPNNGKWTTSGCIMGDGWSIAWRVLDAQFWGVPQRRRRIALIADFGGHSAPEILFVRKSVSRDSEQSQPQRKATPTNASRGTGADDRECVTFQWQAGVESSLCINNNISPALSCSRIPSVTCHAEDIICIDGDKLNKKERKGGSGIGYREGDKQYTLTAKDVHGVVYSVENHPADSRVDIDESGKVQTLTSRMGTGGGNVPMVMTESQVYERHNQDSRITGPIDVGCTISTNAGGREGHLVITPVPNQCFSKSKRAQTETDYETWKESDVANTLNAFDVGDKRTTEAVVYIDTSHADDVVRADDIVAPLQARDFKGGKLIATRYIVRRLTPLECERLQGYPDRWTDIGEWTDSKGKVHKTSDAARYKALGNSIALPPWKWVLKRLCACYERDATLASLFDGIGGFPLIWEQLNGKGSCLWASEIEEFPIAVTKKRIGE